MRKISKNDVKVYYTGDVCPEQIFLFLGDDYTGKNGIGYIRLRFGTLTLNPMVDGEIDFSEYLYNKRFWLRPYKGQFKNQEERNRCVKKCIRKIVRWYNKKYSSVPEPL